MSIDQILAKLPPVKWPQPPPAPTPQKLTHDEAQEQRKRWRLLLWRAQRGQCAWCRRQIDRPSIGTLDHVLPRALGGRDGLGNMLLMHGRCNAEKADGMPSDALWALLQGVNRHLTSGFSAGAEDVRRVLDALRDSGSRPEGENGEAG